jgi:translocation and assembly module TamB
MVDTHTIKPPRRRGLLRGLLLTLLTLLALLVLTGLLLFASVHSNKASSWWLGVLPGVEVTGPQGSLMGDFCADQINISLPQAGGHLRLEKLCWQGVQWSAADAPGVWFHLRLQNLQAQRLVHEPGATQPPKNAPTNLRLPFQLSVDQIQLEELSSPVLGVEPVRGLKAKLQLGAQQGEVHQVDALTLQWGHVHAQGQGRVNTAGDMGVLAELQGRDLRLNASSTASTPAAPPAAPPATTALPLAWQLVVQAAGPLQLIKLTAQLRTEAPSVSKPSPSGGTGPYVAAQATLAPFAAWPLTTLKAQLHQLDLSLFLPTAPKTLLEGEVQWDMSTTSTAANLPPATLSLRNLAPGMWNEGRLPVRAASLSALWMPSASKADTSAATSPTNAPATARRIQLQNLTLDLGNSQQAAGRITGQGEFSANDWTLTTEWRGVTPNLLDPRATAMRLSGPVQAKGQWATPTATPNAPAAPPEPRRWQDMVLQAQAQLRGVLNHDTANKSPSEVALQVDLQGQNQAWTVKRLVASAGSSELSLKGQIERSGTAPWRVQAQAQLKNFDPAPWWPGATSANGARAGSRLQADADVDFFWPGAASGTKGNPQPSFNGATALAGLRGRALVNIEPSTLAGVPLEGQVRWLAPVASSANTPAEFHANLNADGNKLKLDNSDTSSITAPTVWLVNLDAPRLERLSPWWSFFSGQPAASSQTTALAGSLQVQGTWSPAPSNAQTKSSASLVQTWLTQGQSKGEGQAQQLRIGAWQVAQGRVSWQGSLAPSAPLTLHTELTQASAPGLKLNRLVLDLRGSTDAHEISLQAQSPLEAPPWLQALGGVQAKSNKAGQTFATVQARGGLQRSSSGGGITGWSGRLTQWLLRDSNESSTPWWRGSDAELSVAWAADSAPSSRGPADAAATPTSFPLRVNMQPGRAELPGAALKWQQVFWQAATATSPAQINAQIELEAVAVAPLLARLQPEFGWGGDLALAGRVNVRSQPTFTADVQLERIGGDLTVTEDGFTQTLGLSDLRLGLTANNGVWRFSQGLAGSTLGVAAGIVVARTSPTAAWPTADAALEGSIELQVANLGTWGTWVPAGWRLSGELQSSATLAGRWGAPEFTGQLNGKQLGVRNLVQGVAVSDGEIKLSLQGQQARIEHFSAKAGSGRVDLTGLASLGAKPQAQLNLVAQQFQLLGRVDRRIVTSGQAQLRLGSDSVDLTGRFKVDEGLIDISKGDAPTLADDVVVVRAKEEPKPESQDNKAAQPPQPPVKRAVKLDLQVALGDHLRLRGRGLNTGLTGELKLTSPNNQLAMHGTLRTVDGTYDAYRQKLTIDRGQLTFTGKPDVARLDIEATRPNTDVRVGVAVTGTTVTPRIRLFSEPEMPDIDKLSWLVLGRESGGLGNADTALLQRAALALLSGEEDSKTDQLLRNVGIDDLSLRQSTVAGTNASGSANSGGEVRETIVTLGKQLSRRWYVGYERSLNATAGNWQLIYRIAQRFTLRAQSGLENSLDLIWTWRWE